MSVVCYCPRCGVALSIVARRDRMPLRCLNCGKRWKLLLPQPTRRIMPLSDTKTETPDAKAQRTKRLVLTQLGCFALLCAIGIGIYRLAARWQRAQVARAPLAASVRSNTWE